MKGGWLQLCALVTLLILAGCSTAPPTGTPIPPTDTPFPPIELTSSAFGQGEMMTELYTCDGEDISPPLAWGDPPPETRSFVLILDNPDARSVVGKATVHWVLFNLAAEARSLSQAVPSDAELTVGGMHGTNSEGWLGYVGPCPPFTQRYFFRLYALDTVLNLEPGVTADELRETMDGHVLAQGELMGKYKRQ